MTSFKGGGPIFLDANRAKSTAIARGSERRASPSLSDRPPLLRETHCADLPNYASAES
jgi:hypothetical protein